MRFEKYISEESFNFQKGYGLTCIDIDETTFKTFAKIKVMKDGKQVGELDNQEFNTYELKDGETYDMSEFRDARLFATTSIPIPKTINMVRTMLRNIEKNDSNSKIVFLTARADFDDKNAFLDTFKKYGINMDSPNIYVERTGNLKTGTVAEKKKKVILDYMKTGIYRRVRLIDDDIKNLGVITDIEKNLSDDIKKKVIKEYQLEPDTDNPIQFFALLVDSSGNLKKVN